ncbi:IclR family transcriptional regulator [Acidovorax sp. Be4]|uniref:IclR family transcriptional regulator n=1 Tax=Acidovorax bellezanensis TaxID=2976702 RepID=A0ABT2PFR7_9BURK|nr:IclR family transcriptional regulator [Acidovorax sp. Be4]MCT9809202.1 IclR family transcriptional regulator [Acidovorax sp. Be4]
MSPIHLPGLVNPHDLSADRQFAMNLARGMEVLRAFTLAEPLLGNREISERTGLPRPTVSRLTYTLTLLGYLSRVDKLQKYRLGSGVLSLGYPLLASMSVRQIARPIMETVAQATGCSVNLGMRDRTHVVYVESVRADKGNAHLPDIGTTRPLLQSAIGFALILAAPPAESAAILNYLKVHDQAMFEGSRDAFEKARQLFAAEGCCHVAGDWHKDINAVAVPIACVPGEPALAMNCTLYAHRNASEKLLHEVVPLLKKAVRELELAQGLR